MARKAIAAALAGALLGTPAASAAEHNLATAAESRSMIWNAVAVRGERIFVAGPRWTGSKGPAVATIDGAGRPQPYPDAAWNAWAQGGDPRQAFVNVNAIHADGKGGLWVIDTGAPTFGGNPLPGGAKLVKIDLASDTVTRVYAMVPDIAKQGSYIDDIRFHGTKAYITDAGRAGIIVLDIESGVARRVLDDHPSTRARADRPIVVDGAEVKGPDGLRVLVNADPLEISPDGKWLYFGPLAGPWSRIETRWLDDPAVPPQDLAANVEPWIDLPPVGGTAMAPNGDFYFTDLAENALKRRTPDGAITTVIQEDRLSWIDAPFLDARDVIWLPVAQISRAPIFNGGVSKIAWPIALYRIDLSNAR